MSMKDRLKAIRGELSTEEFAEKIGVSRRVVYFWLNGSMEPNAENICKIARTFGVTADYLLGLSNYRTGIWCASRALDYAYENGYRDGLNEAARRVRDVVEKMKEEKHEPSTRT